MRDDTMARLAADTIALLERDGVVAFDRFANRGSRPLRHNGERYRGGNAFSLWATGEIKGYTSPFWMTFKQAQEYGACVRKDEKSSLILYWDRFKVKAKDSAPAAADGDEKTILFAKASCVFNACQIDGLPERFFPVVERNLGFDPLPGAEAFVAATGASICEGGSGAFYSPTADSITMPPRRGFNDAEAFYATLLHELIHWTGPKSRVGRDLSGRFGSESYAAEELVAEIGSAMLCGELGISKAPREDHAHYLRSWLKSLKNDPKLLWTAGSAADKACRFLQAMQPQADAQAKPERLAA